MLKQYSAVPERKLCDQCNQLCVFRVISREFSAMGDGNCRLRWSATVSVVQEFMW